ncbi:MAG: methyltransferase [Bacteroidales bacterium]|jgi:tRNA1Val (adenine37-N6)-methyltransferase|nr:methyltransferase [Bacteroidales bacterium]
MNTIFKFQQFDIIQNSSVWKVGTDGVLLGAVIDCNSANNILDIGTGTGLLALMLVQKSNVFIDAIDINPTAYDLAKQNFNNSKWKNKLSIFNESLQNFKPNKKYDLIVSNPPYFLSGKPALDKNRAIARHATELSPEILAKNVDDLLKKTGKFIIIYPNTEMENFEKIAENHNLFCEKKLFIYPKPNYDYIRIISFFSKTKSNIIETQNITIENEKRHDYSDQYIELTKNYYIKIIK